MTQSNRKLAKRLNCTWSRAKAPSPQESTQFWVVLPEPIEPVALEYNVDGHEACCAYDDAIRILKQKLGAVQ